VVVAQAATALQTARLVDTITHQAQHDDLTGLANRAALADRIECALESARQTNAPVSLFFVDLDGFKLINDKHGHPVGDEVLRLVADRLLGAVRSTDTVARLGGDEFGIVLADLSDLSEVDAASERVGAAFERPFVIDDMAFEVKASIGRAVWPQDASEIEGLMRHADDSMYRVKRAAKPRSGRRARAVGVDRSPRR
jgi:diguanylate cyclase (GGDEF)-like protein